MRLDKGVDSAHSWLPNQRLLPVLRCSPVARAGPRSSHGRGRDARDPKSVAARSAHQDLVCIVQPTEDQMLKFALLFPIVPGATTADVKAITGEFKANMDDYRASRMRLGIAVERVYLQPGPAGDILIAYTEGEHDFAETTRLLASSDAAIDQRFIEHVARVHGIDVRKPPAVPVQPPETIAEWVDPAVTTRRHGLAFAAPVLPGKADAAKAWAHEAFVVRRSELTDSRRALGQNVEVVTLNHTPMGDFGAVYLEGNDPAEANRRFAASRTPYDAWFKDALKPLFPPEIDFNQPVPAVEQIWDYVAQPMMASAEPRR